MPSFDVVSELNKHEVSNAIDQANKEIANRFDFKNVDAYFEQNDNTVLMKAPTDFQLQQMLDILQLKLTKRNIDIKCLEITEPEINLNGARQTVTLREGLSAELSKKLLKLIKDQKYKVQPSIQGDKIRVNGKKRDDLQEVIAFLKQAEVEMPLQFDNFRD